ncbi:MAG: phenylacetate--CoA ligase family protein [Devosia sp.]|nr:phenylacetate--CoA ligase family protein [Devosia sp.]
MKPADLQRQFFEMLMESQYWSPAALIDYQRSQLAQLLRHARKHVPFYERRLDPVFTATGDIDWDRWHEIPIVTRADMADHREAMLARELPPGHGATGTVETSGSTGRPIRITTNRLTAIAANANRWRAHRTYELDWSRTYTARDGYAVAAEWPHGQPLGPWGPGWDAHGARGTSYRISRATGVEQMLEFIERTDSAYLSTGPKILHVYALEAERLGLEVRLACVLTHGEGANAADRAAVKRVFGAAMMETYSSKEAGQIGYPCRLGHGLHVNAESVFVEIVDEQGRAVGPGQSGRIVVTPFVSTAQPLIRYAQGDLARAGGSCLCGRSLPMIGAVEGRTTAIFVHPDGRSVSRMLNESGRDLLRCTFWQIAQVGPLDFELRYVPSDWDAPGDEAAAEALFRSTFFPDSRLRFCRVREIPLTPGGKFLEYVNEWATGR